MIGKTIWHKSFGKGEVCAFETPYIRVRFEDPALGEKAFLYPAAFENFLRFEDEALEAVVKEELAQFQRTEQAYRRKRQEEFRRKEEEQQALLREQAKTKRSAARKKSTSKRSEP